MTNPHDGHEISAVTQAQLDSIAETGLYASPTTLNPAAVNVAEALVAVLQGRADKALLTADLRQLVESVQQTATFGYPWIEAPDGIKISAHTIKLKTEEPRPLVIVPAAWEPLGWLLFEFLYLKLAKRGYHVLGYTPRGLGFPGWFFTSEGTVQVVGPKDWADGTAVIDYAEEYFNPSRIAFLGLSYGSGVSQMVAAHDPKARVDAVVALSTWGDLAISLLDHDTRHLQAVRALVSLTGGKKEEKFDEATLRLLDDFEEGRNFDKVWEWAKERSPSMYIEQTNARGVPTFISNTWHETLFGANEITEHFEKLTVPKHLNMWIGDHGGPEGAGLSIPLAGPNLPMEEALAWLDHHILGTDNGVPDWPAVNSQIMFTYQTRTDPATGKTEITEPAIREPQASWAEFTTSTEHWYLTGGTNGTDGALETEPQTGWTREFTAGQLTDATAVDAPITTGEQEWQGSPKTYSTGKFDRQHLAVWTTAPFPAVSGGGNGGDGTARRIRGVPELTLTVRSTGTAATLVAYLFDVSPDDTARIITHEPLTLLGLTPGQERSASWKLQAAGYDLAAGHRLMLVVNSKDQLYSDANVPDSTITIGSPADGAARLELPLG